MLLTLSPPGVTAVSPAPAGAPSPGPADPATPGSFADALSRATRPAAEDAAPPGGKAAAGTPGRRPGPSKTDAESTPDPDEPVNILGLVPLETRLQPTPLTGDGSAARLGSRPAAASSEAPACTPLEQAVEALRADALKTAPDTAADAMAPPGAMPTGPGPREAGQFLAPARPAVRGAAAPAAATDAQAAASATPASPAATVVPSLPPVAGGDTLSAADQERAGGDSQRHASGPAAPSTPAQAPLPVADTSTTDTAMAASPASAAQASLVPVMDPGGFTGLPLAGVPPQGAAIAAAPDLPAPPPRLAVDPEVGSREWGRALGQQLLQLGRAGQDTAELQLNPPGLGPLKVSLSMNDHQIQATFVSAHSSVRAAVEAALPQLRAALADSGISLGGTSVGSDSRQQADVHQGQHERQGQRNEPRNLPGTPALPVERSAFEPRQRAASASVDIYA